MRPRSQKWVQKKRKIAWTAASCSIQYSWQLSECTCATGTTRTHSSSPGKCLPYDKPDKHTNHSWHHQMWGSLRLAPITKPPLMILTFAYIHPHTTQLHMHTLYNHTSQMNFGYTPKVCTRIWPGKKLLIIGFCVDKSTLLLSLSM